MIKSKLYWVSMFPFLLAGVFLAVILPKETKAFAILTPLVFWVWYYTIAYLIRKQNNKS